MRSRAGTSKITFSSHQALGLCTDPNSNEWDLRASFVVSLPQSHSVTLSLCGSFWVKVSFCKIIIGHHMLCNSIVPSVLARCNWWVLSEHYGHRNMIVRIFITSTIGTIDQSADLLWLFQDICTPILAPLSRMAHARIHHCAVTCRVTCALYLGNTWYLLRRSDSKYNSSVFPVPSQILARDFLVSIPHSSLSIPCCCCLCFCYFWLVFKSWKWRRTTP